MLLVEHNRRARLASNEQVWTVACFVIEATSVTILEETVRKLLNPTHRSGWIFQVPPTPSARGLPVIILFSLFLAFARKRTIINNGRHPVALL
jgi:hypothetical protein